jgi:Cu(I)/Ag(I) efflux system membrane fusion protein
MNKFTLSIVCLALGLAGGYALNSNALLGGANHQAQAEPSASSEPQPLYWVAPMDPNYRRDKPGLSPMGMELVPVYEDNNAKASAGTVTISPNVVNNLGVRSKEVILASFTPDLQAVGSLSFNQDKLWQMNSRVSGWVEKLYLKAEGEYLEKGQKLLSLYSPELLKAQEDLLNALRLGNRQLIASSKLRLQVLGVSPSQIKQLEKSKKVSQLIDLYAPESGYVAKLGVREGAYISPATQLVEAGSLEDIWLIAELYESQASLVKLGDQALMQVDSFAGEQWQGEVDYIYPVLDPSTRTLRVRIKFANQDQRLKPNMYARVKLQTATPQASLQIPREAVIYSGGFSRVVMDRGEGQFQSVKVQVGRESAGMVEILAGLREGDKVVTSAQFLLDSESSLSADFSRMGPPDRQVNNMDHSNMDHSTMDHSSMDHSTMDHSSMNHSSMDHSNMDHSTMDHGSMNQGSMDHSNMDHSTMDHSSMNQGSMDHSTIDHSTMDHSSMNQGSMDHSTMDHGSMNHSNMAMPEQGQSSDDDELDWLDLDADESPAAGDGK